MIVMKFGGTSLESSDAITRVTAIVKRHKGRRPIVVVSAMGKTTNALLALAAEASAGRREQALATLDELRTKHLDHALPVAGAAAADLDRYIRAHFDWLEDLVRGLAVVGELSGRSMDAVASVGERLSSLIVTYALSAAGVRAQHADARRLIVTDAQFTRAQPMLDATYGRLREAVKPQAETAVVVMGGFIGATQDGQTTTLGRGGSDYSASLVGAGVDADEIQIWTDVDGMLTADPRIVADARRVETISFAEAAEMAYFGAKVLHPATIAPAVEKNIPVVILNSRRPELSGTRITSESAECASSVKSIACKRGITILNIQSSRMLMAHGFMRRIFEIFDRYRTSVDMVSTSEVSVSLTIDNSEHLDEIRRELAQFSDVRVQDERAIVCLIGDNLHHTPGIAGRAFSVVRSNVQMISQGASLLNLGFVVAESDLNGAVERLHQEFFAG